MKRSASARWKGDLKRGTPTGCQRQGAGADEQAFLEAANEAKDALRGIESTERRHRHGREADVGRSEGSRSALEGASGVGLLGG